MAIGNPVSTTSSSVASKTSSVIATAGQTLFTVPAGYVTNHISVFRNGIRLVDGRDYEARNGATVTLLAAATVGDVIEFHVFDTFSVADAVTNQGGTIFGNLTVEGSIGDITANNVTGVAATFTGAVSVGGVLTYEDVTNVDSIGIMTARSGLNVTGGSLGVGLNNPTSYGNFADDFVIYNASQPGMTLASGSTSGYGSIYFADGTSGNTVSRGQIQYSHSNDFMQFSTAATERLRIDSSGRMGLGTNSPSAPLHITNVSPKIILTDSDNSSDISVSSIGGAGVYETASDSIFKTNSAERMRIDSSGRMGLGTNSPEEILHIAAASETVNSRDGVMFQSTSSLAADTGLPIVFTSHVGNFANYGVASIAGRKENATSANAAGYLQFATGSSGGAISEKMRIDSSGRLLVGTTTPGDAAADNLTIHSSGDTGITIRASESDSSSIYFADGAGGTNVYTGAIIYDHATNHMSLHTNSGAERMRIDSAGRLLINHTADTAAGGYASILQVCDTSYQGSSISLRRDGGTGGPALVFGKSRSSSKGGVDIVSSGDNLGSVSFYGADGTDVATPAAQIRCEVDGTPGSNDMPGRIIFATTSDGAASTTERMRIDSSGRMGLGTQSPGRTLDVNGIIRADGTSGALAFGGNSSTPSEGVAIHRPANDTLALCTASSERMRIDSAGRLLVGATSARSFTAPAQLFQIEAADGSGSGRICIGTNNNDNTAGPGIYMYRSRGGSLGSNVIVQDGDDIGSIYFQGADGTDVLTRAAQIRCEIDGTPGSNVMPGALLFSTTNTSGSGPHERMRIDSSGRLLIGATSYTATDASLVVDNNVSGGSAIAEFRNEVNPNYGGLRISGGFTDRECRLQATYGNSFLTFYTEPSSGGAKERMRITSDGNIQITYPDNSTGLRNKIAFVSESPHLDETAYIAANRTAVSGAPSDLVFATGSVGSVSERLRLTSAGNLGIGQPNPQGNLHLGTETGANQNIVMHTANNGGARLRFREGGSLTTGFNEYSFGMAGNQNAMTFEKQGLGEVMRIHSNGSLLVGRNAAYNSSPGEMGVFQGAAHGVVIYQTANANYTNLILRNTYANYGSNNVSGNMITFTDQGGTERGKIAINGSSTSYITSSDYRLKENVVDITDGITRVKQLQPKRFNFIVDADTTVDGFLAHEAQTVVPEAITGTHNEVEVWQETDELPEGVSVGDNKLDDEGNTVPVMQGIDQAKLVPLLTAALQEAIAKIETLETANADLVARVTALEG